jgi:hypothetical protein
MHRQLSRLALIEPMLLILLARSSLRLIGLKHVCRVLRTTPGAKATIKPSPAEREAAERVKLRLAHAARHLGGDNDCLPQSLAAAAMLRLRGGRPTLHLGVLKQRSLRAHAWLAVGDVIVAGEAQRYAFDEMNNRS